MDEDVTAQVQDLAQNCNQGELYPSASKGWVPIADMDPVHAFNAWRRMRMLLLPQWRTMIHSELAVALLNQAFDGQAHNVLPTPATELTLELVFDALDSVDKAFDEDQHPFHPITRARIVLEYLTKETND